MAYQPARERRKNAPGAGRPFGPSMPCGWGCGKAMRAGEIRAHFRDCPKRPGRPAREEGDQPHTSGVRVAESSSGAPHEEALIKPNPAEPDQAPSLRKYEEVVRKVLLSSFRNSGRQTPSGPVPDQAVAVLLRQLGLGIEALDHFFRAYFDRFKDPPGSWDHTINLFKRWVSATKSTPPRKNWWY